MKNKKKEEGVVFEPLTDRKCMLIDLWDSIQTPDIKCEALQFVYKESDFLLCLKELEEKTFITATTGIRVVMWSDFTRLFGVNKK